MEQWLAQNWFSLFSMLVILVTVAVAFGRYEVRILNVEKETATNKTDIQALSKLLNDHRENTDRHRDPERDGRQYDDLVKRLDRIEGKLDRLTEQS